MNTSDFLNTIINPTLAAMGPRMASDEARVMLLAIAHQESALTDRRQVGRDGHWLDKLARGWWQFESGGGVAGATGKAGKAGACRNTGAADGGPAVRCLAWNLAHGCFFLDASLKAAPSRPATLGPLKQIRVERTLPAGRIPIVEQRRFIQQSR